MPTTHKKIDITIARGDGIGPEIMDATLTILKSAGAPLIFHEIEVGEKAYLQGHSSGIRPESWETLFSTQAFLKAPITTPQGGGFRSLNVSIRTALGLYANIRPCRAYAPYVDTKHPEMDVVIIRENEEDLYTGIEYRQTQDSYHALKVMTAQGSERIIRYAFEYAVANNRKKVTCFTKDNILKLTDGLFHKTFDRIAKEYPKITPEHWIIDIGSAKLADTPENFDVIVLPNLYGDILSDVAAQIAGSVGLAGSANIGVKGAMFEAIHGSAPRRAGQNLANPSGLLLSSLMLLEYVGLPETAYLIHNAWLKTLEDGIHTYDIFNKKHSQQQAGTKEFAEAVIARLGKKPEKLHEALLAKNVDLTKLQFQKQPKETKTLVGVDIFIEAEKNPLHHIQKMLSQAPSFKLSMIANRGLVVYPEGPQEAAFSDVWRARFTGSHLQEKDIVELERHLLNANLSYTKLEKLYIIGQEKGFSLSPYEQ
jgi:isocitrate dehydrogenase